MSGRMVDAAEALSIGIADKVLPDEEVVAIAVDDAKRWASGPTLAYAAAKRAMLAGFGVGEGLAVEIEQFRWLFNTADAREGLEAFVDKRDAGFTGT